MEDKKLKALLKLKIDIQDREEVLREDKKESCKLSFKIKTNAQKVSQLKNELVESI